MKVVQSLVPESKWKIKCPYDMDPEFIVVHNTANDATAANEIAYMIRNDSKVSFHYAIDDHEVVQGVLLNRNAWHAGDGGSGKGNRKGIAVEICYSKSGGPKFEAAEKLAAEFIASILKERNWDISKVTKHQDYSKKYCPHRTLDLGWQRFLDMVSNELAALSGTPIMGKTEVTAEQMKAYLLMNNPNPKLNMDLLEWCKIWIEEAEVEGVNAGPAFCQMCHEIGFLKYGGQVLPEQNNYGGIGATNNSAVGKGAWFDTPRIGVRASIQHLKAYGSKDSLKNECVDPRFKLVKRGCALNFEDLSGKWAWPGYDKAKYKSLNAAKISEDTYGHRIIMNYKDIMSWNDELLMELKSKKISEMEAMLLKMLEILKSI
ncbi:MAG: N-acetylmuramoyl-L-alanine amidase [Clostridia bacterium]|nr:N-acetylmuramoyl-L-alanine amidase [Clostridia bacterium]